MQKKHSSHIMSGVNAMAMKMPMVAPLDKSLLLSASNMCAVMAGPTGLVAVWQPCIAMSRSVFDHGCNAGWRSMPSDQQVNAS